MLVLDTSVLLAAADGDEPDHVACAELIELRPANDLLVPTTVVTEASWMIESRLGARSEADFLHSIVDGELTRVDLIETDWDRALELIETYADLSLGLVDASIVAVAERFNICEVGTLNGRDFRVVRPRHADAFELLPAI